MIEFTGATFPFASDLVKSGGHINDTCQAEQRSPTEPICPFVVLSAFSFSNAFVVAMLASFVDDLHCLNDHVTEIITYLDRSTTDAPIKIDPLRVATAIERAGDMKRHLGLFNVDHPATSLFLDRMQDWDKEKVDKDKRIADVQNRIGRVIEQLTTIRSPGFPDKDKGEPKNNAKALREATCTFGQWLTGLEKLRRNTGEYILICRDRYMNPFTPFKENERRSVLQAQLKEKAKNLIKDIECTLHDGLTPQVDSW